MKYRYHWSFKLLALILAVVSGAVLMLGCGGLILGELGYYERTRQGQLYDNVDYYCRDAAEAVFDRFAWEGTGIEPKLFERFFRWGADVDAVDLLEFDFYYSISQGAQILESNIVGDVSGEFVRDQLFDVRRGYVTVMPMAEYYPTYHEFMEPREGLVYAGLDGTPLPPLGEGVTEYEYYVVSDDGQVNWENISVPNYHHAEAQGAPYTIYRLEYTGYETYMVTVLMTAEQMVSLVDAPLGEEFLPRLLEEYQADFGPMAIWGLVVLLLSLLWLALIAGKSPDRVEAKPAGLNLIPLDVYLVLAGLGGICMIALTSMALDEMIWNSAHGIYDQGMEYFYWDVALLSLAGMGVGGILALFTMAFAAQLKVGNNYWLKHSLIGMVWTRGGALLIRGVKGLWKLIKGTVRGIRTVCVRLVNLLPLTWQWLIASGLLWLMMMVCCLSAAWTGNLLPSFLGVLVTVVLVLYGAYCFGVLRDRAKKMAEGNLEEKLENQHLLGCFGEFAAHLNALGDTCVEAARQQMKSERMKSELITNVSHDIKTPLTSIINYVDLLQKTRDENERAEYLEVLDRQSQRLKKLIEDLMEMSRASSGNMSVEITPTDVTEAVNQALGEFADTLGSCGLSVMQKVPTEPVMALADGKHLWRVLSNCLSNVVKYAMHGTRVYVDVQKRGQKVEISIKNISAGMLNITAEELMERFVRGDASRNTEGNGLGLNIAKSLMELQGGRLELVIDGDLFKVVLTLNAA